MNTTQELAEVLTLKPLQGLTVPQALQAARAEYSIRLRHFQMWAVDRSNERAYRAAREALEVIENVVEVLEAAMTPEPAPVAQATLVKPSARCPWHSAIRYFFGCAKGAALDTKAETEMREALAAFIGRQIGSRSELSAGEWLTCGDAVKFGRLVW